MAYRVHPALVLFACACLHGCATLPNGRLWGQDATLQPGWQRVRDSAAAAARSPWVWAPLAGAAAFQIDDFDRRTSDWAREHNPIFGSQASADDWSDDLRTVSSIALVATIVATPGGDDAHDWWVAKSKGTLTQLSAVAVTSGMTGVLKSAIGRERPNGVDDESFPSGHAATSAVETRLASDNLRSMDLGPGTRRSLDVGLAALTFGTAWARVEAGQHFPSDTLFSIALGNFMGAFINDAFLGLEDSSTAVAFAPLEGGGLVSWAYRF